MATSKDLGESDIATIFVDKKTFKVNKKTLEDKSDFFAAMFASRMTETIQNSAVLHDVSAGVFRDLLVFMETGKLRCEIDEELLTAAAFLQMRGVIEHSIRNVNITNCIEFLSVAETHCLPEVEEAVLKFLTENFLDVISSKTFKQFSGDLIDSVVKRRHASKQCLFGFGSYDDAEKERSDISRVMHLFDDVTEQWQTGCALPPTLCTHACGVAVLYNYIFVVGGYSSSECRQMQQVATYYDPISNNWKDVPFMNQSRAHFALIPHDDYLYALGGCVSFSTQGSSVKKLLSSVEAYSLRGRAWVRVASLPKETAQPCGTSCRGYIYTTIVRPMDEMLTRYDPEEDVWEDVEIVPYMRFVQCMASYKEKVYLLGQWDLVSGIVRDFQSYDVITRQWTKLYKPITGQYFDSCVVWGDNLFLSE
uniref:BTB domain-containing protein n=1 Tax=Branchiostoma floridae TaxID=7739 RepID=C3YKP4_BRAFL|eukprot:XP_002603101.1 hypothetical protein BRAFLDRAFT_116960 [Branchiostoma floridae]